MTPLDCSASVTPSTFRPAGASGPNGADAIHGHGPPATARGQVCAWRSLRPERACRLGDLLAVPRRGVPGQPQGVPGVARDDVNVEVEDGLPSRDVSRIEYFLSVRAQTFLHARGHRL